MNCNDDWKIAFEVALRNFNPSLLNDLLRGESALSPLHRAALSYLLTWTKFKDVFGKDIDRNQIRLLLTKISGDHDVAHGIRFELADFLAKSRLGRRSPGNVPIPPWKDTRAALKV
jgi:hypothetical protein